MSDHAFVTALPPSMLDDHELREQLHLSERADWNLLRLVACTSVATLVLALAICITR